MTVLVVVLVIVIGGVLAGVAAVLLGQQISTTGPGPGHIMGISFSRSPDGTNWSLLFRSVPSPETPSGVRLAIMTWGGATALMATAFASLTYAVDRAAYFQAQPRVEVLPGDGLLISIPTYPAGYSYQISDDIGVLATGAFS